MTVKINADTSDGLKFVSDTSGEIDLQTNGTTKVHMDSSGNVGIGTTNPDGALTIQATGASDITYKYTDGNTKAFSKFDNSDFTFKEGTVGNDAYTFFTNNTERMRIDSSGRVTIASIPSFLASGSSGTNATVSANNKFSFGSTDYNTGSHYSTTNSRFTCPVSGLYWFYVSLHADTDADECRPSLRVNGSDYTISTDAIQAYAKTPSPSVIQLNMSIALDLSANDYVEVWARAGAGSTLYYQGHSWFGGYLIG